MNKKNDSKAPNVSVESLCHWLILSKSVQLLTVTIQHHTYLIFRGTSRQQNFLCIKELRQRLCNWSSAFIGCLVYEGAGFIHRILFLRDIMSTAIIKSKKKGNIIVGRKGGNHGVIQKIIQPQCVANDSITTQKIDMLCIERQLSIVRYSASQYKCYWKEKQSPENFSKSRNQLSGKLYLFSAVWRAFSFIEVDRYFSV